MNEQWLTIAQAAEVLQVSPTFLRDKVTAYEVPHHRLGSLRCVRFSPEDMKAIDAMTAKPVAPAATVHDISSAKQRILARARRAS